MAYSQAISGHMPSTDPPAFRRRVIFTADDFGLSPLLNQAVALAYGAGLLRCASLMAGGPAVDQALTLSRQLPGLCLGVHLTLIQGRAVLPPQALPRLVDAAGRFSQNPVLTGWRYFNNPSLLPEISRELRAQIETVLEAGLTPWYLNSHLNLHLHPRLAPLVVDLAREYAIPALRLAREDWRTTLWLAPQGKFPKMALGLIFTVLSRRTRSLAVAAGLVVNDHLFGLTHHGRLTEDHLLRLIPQLRPGVTEILSHPATGVDPVLKQAHPAYLREGEFLALLSPRLKEVLRAQGVEVTSYRDLAATAPRAGGSNFSP
jgi:hopanoid biosynthesis associated protein HpnK|uniref:ChbG/HpnK family deacetylase n=1 Tax=Desulfobacca acetoxidans TaxID=60893 RepID=A0A7C5ESE7_9BACT